MRSTCPTIITGLCPHKWQSGSTSRLAMRRPPRREEFKVKRKNNTFPGVLITNYRSINSLFLDSEGIWPPGSDLVLQMGLTAFLLLFVNCLQRSGMETGGENVQREKKHQQHKKVIVWTDQHFFGVT